MYYVSNISEWLLWSTTIIFHEHDTTNMNIKIIYNTYD